MKRLQEATMDDVCATMLYATISGGLRRIPPEIHQ
jgi:hypothetical protein